MIYIKLNTSKTALTLALLIGGAHLGWSVLVALGLAQALLDFIFWVHMIANPYQVTGFNLTQAGILLVVTSAVGYAVGWIFATVWNRVNK